MRLKQFPSLQSGYVISALLHVVALLILAFFAIKPVLPLKWHSFEWDASLFKEYSTEAASSGSTETPATEAAAQSASSTPANAAELSGAINTHNSDSQLLEPPATASPTDNRKSAAMSRLEEYSRNRGTNPSDGNKGFSASLEQGNGEAYIISLPKPQIVPKEEGEVYMEFRLTAKGEVDMNSVVFLSFSSAAYVESVQRVMRLWRFGFRSTYNPNRNYRIRCNFVVNEN